MTSLNRRQLLTAGALGAAAVPLAASAAGAASQSVARNVTYPVTPGADRAAAAGWSVLAGRKVGIITNPTGILTNLRTIVDEMHEAGTVDIRGVFGPEHGFRGTAQAGDSEGTHTDPRTGVTVYDAYGAGTDKMASMFRAAGVDTVVFDIQDAGARFYTYIWTMYTAMKAAVQTGARFVVLDRPNPTGGTARGPMMTTAYTSGVGAKEIVQAHGMTVGELARFFDGEFLEAEVGGRLAGHPVCRDRPPVGHAQSEHAHARHGAGLPGHRDVRGHEPLGGPGHHASVRARWRPVRGLPLGGAPRRPRPAGCGLP